MKNLALRVFAAKNNNNYIYALSLDITGIAKYKY